MGTRTVGTTSRKTGGIFVPIFSVATSQRGGVMTKIEFRGEVLPGYVPGLPEDMVKVQRKAGPF